MNRKILVALIVSVVLLSLASAYILDEHIAIGNKALSETKNSPITQSIMPYKDYFALGSELPDISVVTYFDKNCDATGLGGRISCFFKFNIGRPYLASHSQSSCLAFLSKAQAEPDAVMRGKEIAFSYGWCSHGIEDADSHNHMVNLAIARSMLFNGLIHSPVEIYAKNKVTNAQDRIYTRKVLDLSPEMTPFVESVLNQNPAFDNIKVANLIDFFSKQVQGSSEYNLGFQSFFSVPSYLLWLVAITLILSLAMIGLVLRKVRDGVRNAAIVFIGVFALVILFFVVLAIYGVMTGKLWSIWEVLSQYIFSGWMYPVAVILLGIGLWLIYSFFKKPDKKNNIYILLVGILTILFSLVFFNLPSTFNGIDAQGLFNLSVIHVEAMLTQGVNYIQSIQDPAGTIALADAQASGAPVRTGFLVAIILLLVGIAYYALKKRT